MHYDLALTTTGIIYIYTKDGYTIQKCSARPEENLNCSVARDTHNQCTLEN